VYGWLSGRHFGVIVAADREEPLLVVRLGDFLRQCAFRQPAPPGAAEKPDSGCGPGNGAKP